ncbi:Protein C8orf37 [Liparis tanakae]|uniref:Cilia- and flagella-associated protein 418 n=1 Tax=Liparis tanakae TaxID=230148 RepID=A0A4Z2EY77_9TELE|nr:Protein C8orf37 [Liparis tanakae]
MEAEDLDELLDDAERRFCRGGSDATSTGSSARGAAGHVTRRCCPVFLGGSSVPSGVGTATSKRSCDQLRCTSCDFRVLTFDDCEWDASCDYLFLR